MTKRFLCTLTALLLCLACLCGCGKKVEPAPEPNTVTVTFPEGYTVTQYAALLEKNNVCSAAAFEDACRTIPAGYESVLGETKQDGRVFALEGYLFPDTYEFYLGENVDSVLSRFLKNTVSKVDASMIEQAKAKGLTVNQLFTLASIVQAECSVPNEMPHVSSVFWNRLNSTGFPYLGSDPTRQYIEQKMKSYIDAHADLYNYDNLFANYCTNDGYSKKISGLPVGPIGNPGSHALNAVLNPSSTGDYYFFTDVNMGYHYYTNYRDFCNEWQYKYKH